LNNVTNLIPMPFLRVSDGLTFLRVVCGALLAFRPALSFLIVGVVTDWLDGPIARRAPASSYGARLDL
jgi:phosphatidylglycerophosphate synthase